MCYKTYKSNRSLSASLLLVVVPIAVYAFVQLIRKPKKVFVKDFSVYCNTDPLYQTSNTFFLEMGRSLYKQRSSAMNFLRKISLRNGMGPKCALPPAMVNHKQPPFTIEDSREEIECCIYPTVQKLLDKTGISAKQIDILVTNCIIFCPTPSISSMIVNKFKMRSSIRSFNLGGMGCSAGPIGADLC